MSVVPPLTWRRGQQALQWYTMSHPSGARRDKIVGHPGPDGKVRDLDQTKLVGRWSGSGTFFNVELQKKI